MHPILTLMLLAHNDDGNTSDSRIKEQQTTSIPDPLQTRPSDKSRHSDKALHPLETEIPRRRRRRPKPDWYDNLLEATKNGHITLPPTVQSWYIHCRERTELSQQRSKFVDDKPRWTLGLTRALYVEHMPVCIRCHKLRLPAARIVTVDESLPSVPYKYLALCHKSFDNFDRVLRAKLLDHWPASSKRSRWHGKEGDEATTSEHAYGLTSEV